MLTPADTKIQTSQEYYGSEFFRFHNGLRVLLNIDAAEFPGPRSEWPRFRDHPHLYFIECDDATSAALWAIIERRNHRFAGAAQ